MTGMPNPRPRCKAEPRSVELRLPPRPGLKAVSRLHASSRATPTTHTLSHHTKVQAQRDITQHSTQHPHPQKRCPAQAPHLASQKPTRAPSPRPNTSADSAKPSPTGGASPLLTSLAAASVPPTNPLLHTVSVLVEFYSSRAKLKSMLDVYRRSSLLLRRPAARKPGFRLILWPKRRKGRKKGCRHPTRQAHVTRNYTVMLIGCRIDLRWAVRI